MKILFPMVGLGSRFAAHGFTQPKPMIPTLGRPMIAVVLECYPRDASFVFVIRAEHEALGLADILRAERPNAAIVTTAQETAGPVATALLARHLVDDDEDLLVADCDSYLVWPFDWIWSWMIDRGADGGVTVRRSSDPACSYAAIDDDGWVTETREKDPFTPFSTTGPYWWRRGHDFVVAADAAGPDDSVGGELYVCPLYNHLIQSGGRVLAFFLSEFWSLGTPIAHRAFEDRFRGT
ncbi:MAG: glycosyltransferase family 2 protein [Actinobacteria bacterium]|nr:glycosyltransferase family 2 protein [Actinomycetota bacterium]